MKAGDSVITIDPNGLFVQYTEATVKHLCLDDMILIEVDGVWANVEKDGWVKKEEYAISPYAFYHYSRDFVLPRCYRNGYEVDRVIDVYPAVDNMFVVVTYDGLKHLIDKDMESLTFEGTLTPPATNKFKHGEFVAKVHETGIVTGCGLRNGEWEYLVAVDHHHEMVFRESELTPASPLSVLRWWDKANISLRLNRQHPKVSFKSWGNKVILRDLLGDSVDVVGIGFGDLTVEQLRTCFGE